MKKKFEIIFTDQFRRDLEGLDKQTQIRILREIQILKENPFAGKLLHYELRGLLSLRIGDYRVIYRIAEDKVILRTAGHRRVVYK